MPRQSCSPLWFDYPTFVASPVSRVRFNNKCHNIRITPGDDGRDFVTVELCGDDFLAALADSVAESEDWDDPQAIESETCAELNDIYKREGTRREISSKEESSRISGGKSTSVNHSSEDEMDLEVVSDMVESSDRFLRSGADCASCVDNCSYVSKGKHMNYFKF